MELIYKESESSVKPKEIERTNTTVYLRKDIEERQKIVERDDNQYMVQYYVYQEATLSYEEFDEYASESMSMNAIKGINDSENISKIVQNGVDNEDNQLILMEAMADLYDLLANLM